MRSALSLKYLSCKRVKSYSKYLPRRLSAGVDVLKRCCLEHERNASSVLLAAKYGHLECLKFFLVSTNISNTDQKKITTAALQYRHFHIVRYLANLHFAFDAKHVVRNCNVQSLKVLSQLQLFDFSFIEEAIVFNKPKCLRLLMSQGLQANSGHASKAIELGHLGCFYILLEEGVELDETCLLNAINLNTFQSRKLVDVLLEYDTPVGSQSLCEAVKKDDSRIYTSILNYILHFPTNAYVSTECLKVLVDTNKVNVLVDLESFVHPNVALEGAKYAIKTDMNIFLEKLVRGSLTSPKFNKEHVELFNQAVACNSAKCIDYFVRRSWFKYLSREEK